MNKNIKEAYFCLGLFFAFIYACFFVGLACAFKWWTIPTVFMFAVIALTFFGLSKDLAKTAKEEEE